MEDKGAPAVAGVHILDLPYCLDREFDYSIPSAMTGNVSVGCFVSVPFGRGDRQRLAVVTSVSCKSAHLSDGGAPVRLKAVSALCPGNISLDGGMMRVADYLCSRTLCTYGEAVRALIPSYALTKLIPVLEPVPGAAVPSGFPFIIK